MSQPLAVQQWTGLIAVNYESRKHGVKRGDNAAEAKRKCPSITLVHVATVCDTGTNDAMSADAHDRAEKVSRKDVDPRIH
jgi:DNA polymerase eta